MPGLPQNAQPKWLIPTPQRLPSNVRGGEQNPCQKKVQGKAERSAAEVADLVLPGGAEEARAVQEESQAAPPAQAAHALVCAAAFGTAALSARIG